MIPSRVSAGLISGIPGAISHDGPTRVTTAVLNSATGVNMFGCAYTYADDTVETVQVGGTGVFAGIMIHPHAQIVEDDGSVANGRVGEFLTMGEVYVELSSAGGDIGDAVWFDTATGELEAGTPAEGDVVVGVLSRHVPSSQTPTLAVVKLTDNPSVTPAP